MRRLGGAWDSEGPGSEMVGFEGDWLGSGEFSRDMAQKGWGFGGGWLRKVGIEEAGLEVEDF